MTFEEFARQHLCKNGMFEKDANKVIDEAKGDDILSQTMDRRWADDFEGYPREFMSAFIFSIDKVALDYIDENFPRAWFRPYFAR